MRILHVFRSPVGGLFRHVRDLARGQSELGHRVGIMCDSSTGGPGAAQLLEACQTYCLAGIETHPISRLPSLSDVAAMSACSRQVQEKGFDVLHGHGAKGGLIARIVGKRLGIPSIYTPHGGSLHFSWANPSGAAFLTTEKILSRMGSGFVFVCDFEKSAFATKIGLAGKPAAVVHNGLWPEDFGPVTHQANATDLLFVGEVRHLKGIDLLFQAMLELKSLPNLSLTVVGDGPELQQHVDLSRSIGLQNRVTFAGRLPIGEALKRGRMMVVPSRQESFPYVVLETMARGVPIVATRVGGIPEMLPDNMTCPPSAAAIADRINAAHANDTATHKAAADLAASVRQRFSASIMSARIAAFYASVSR
jgi:glycosyltransferase involved in cell wall biosynthesis